MVKKKAPNIIVVHTLDWQWRLAVQNEYNLFCDSSAKVNIFVWMFFFVTVELVYFWRVPASFSTAVIQFEIRSVEQWNSRIHPKMHFAILISTRTRKSTTNKTALLVLASEKQVTQNDHCRFLFSKFVLVASLHFAARSIVYIKCNAACSVVDQHKNGKETTKNERVYNDSNICDSWAVQCNLHCSSDVVTWKKSRLLGRGRIWMNLCLVQCKIALN